MRVGLLSYSHFFFFLQKKSIFAETKYSNMPKEFTYEELLHKAAAYCSVSEHCVKEVENKLNAWGAASDTSDTIIRYLIQNNFISEKRYADAFVKDKFRFNKWGKVKIGLMLKGKGIASNFISEALNRIDYDDYLIILEELMQGKLKSIRYSDEYEKKGKLFRFAQGRGFEMNVCEEVYKQLENKNR